MSWMEVALLVLGIGVFGVSFMLPGSKEKESDEQNIDNELIKSLIEKEIGNVKQRVNDVVDETIEYAVEKTERASERISNEKIMAINDYSETVLADINKSHQEVMFLYDMLNDKHKNIKETVKHVDKTAKEAEEAAFCGRPPRQCTAFPTFPVLPADGCGCPPATGYRKHRCGPPSPP